MSYSVITGDRIIKLILNMIRYDIPISLVGESSIGKSYTLIELCKKWHLNNNILYIGSEKAENIEGVPKLTERRADNQDTLEYLKPYWYPNSVNIQEQVKSGRKIYEKFISEAWIATEEFTPTFDNLQAILSAIIDLEYGSVGDSITKIEQPLRDGGGVVSPTAGTARILSKPFVFERELRKKEDAQKVGIVSGDHKRDDLRDFCNYITTILGYGNNWLILDELDKVEEYDKDKFAPMLHIVRERTLKNWSLRPINEGKGLPIPAVLRGDDYSPVIEVVNSMLHNDLFVMDTKVIAIANKTSNIEEALFRRFLQIIAEDTMQLVPPNQDLGRIAQCAKEVEDSMEKEGGESGSGEPSIMTINPLVGKLLEGSGGSSGSTSLKREGKLQFLDAVNLQWQYGFLPKILNNYDIQGNFVRRDFLELYLKAKHKYPSEAEADKLLAYIMEQAPSRVFYKILRDNFGLDTDSEALINTMFRCFTKEYLLGQDLGLVASAAGGVAGRRKEFADYDQQGLSAEEQISKIVASLNDQQQSVTTDTALAGSLEWTKYVMDTMEAMLFDNGNNFRLTDLNAKLFPILLHMMYGNWIRGKWGDLLLTYDGIVANMELMQSYFARFVQKNDFVQGFKADEGLTQTMFYGAPKDQIPNMTADQRKNASTNSLYGCDIDNYWHSISFFLYYTRMFPMFMTEFVNSGIPQDVPKCNKFFKDNEGVGRFLKKPFMIDALNKWKDAALEAIKTMKGASATDAKKRVISVDNILAAIKSIN